MELHKCTSMRTEFDVCRTESGNETRLSLPPERNKLSQFLVQVLDLGHPRQEYQDSATRVVLTVTPGRQEDAM